MNLPALATDQMIEVDRLMIEKYGIVLVQMMENAGRQLAEQARRMLGDLNACRIVVLCGAGNNGGGMVAARHLHNRGAQVHVKLAGDRDRLKEVPAHQGRRFAAEAGWRTGAACPEGQGQQRTPDSLW